MANIDSQIGLRPINNPYGNECPIHEYELAATNTTAIYEGALVYKSETGVRLWDGADTTEALSMVGVAAHYVPAAPLAAGVTNLAVYDDPNQWYVVQGDANDITGVVGALAVKGWYTGVVSASSVNTTTLQSKLELNTGATTSTWTAALAMQILDVASDPRNDLSAINEKWIVKIATGNHYITSGGPQDTE